MGVMTYTGTLMVVTCHCGIVHGIPKDLNVQARRNGKTIYCPLGHAWIYSESDADRAEVERDEARAALLRERESLAFQRERLATERRSHAATKGQLTKTKNRVAKGVCPCCNRQFVNLHRHMAGQHPDYTE